MEVLEQRPVGTYLFRPRYVTFIFFCSALPTTPAGLFVPKKKMPNEKKKKKKNDSICAASLAV
jgi:hypothetical protein